MKEGTITISWGAYGGFYFRRKHMTRLCLGWVAFTYFPHDIDDVIRLGLRR